ncbi:signal peptide containing protein [Cryptosporidium ryanae]|uniref:signal peptide containing protein n=1 Tax=Cryptosporidium ryanae TaxID=515981 RepID=UPI00351A2661|nr:signal peptide containing protein [Cryptosporidium ryanae]
MRPNYYFRLLCLAFAVCFHRSRTLVDSQTVEASIGSDLEISSRVNLTDDGSRLEEVADSKEGSGESSEELSVFNPEIIPVNQNNTGDLCFNRTLPVDCSNSNSTLQKPITSRYTATISGKANSSISKFIFLSEEDEEMVSFSYNVNSKEGIASVRSLVNNTQVSRNITTVSLEKYWSDFPVDSNNQASFSVAFVMVLTNTTVSFTVNNLVYTILNVNFAEYPIFVSRIQVQGLDGPRISLQPFVGNSLNSESCTMDPPYGGGQVSDESLSILPYALTCLTRNFLLPESMPAGSQILIGIPCETFGKSTRISPLTQVVLSSRSGVVIFNLFINDKGLFIRSGRGTDIIQSKGGYFPFMSYGFQSYSIRITFTSLFVTVSVNGFRPFNQIPIPDGETAGSIFISGLNRNPTFTFLPNRSCTKFSYSGDAECSLDGVIPNFKSLGSLDDNIHAEATVAVRMASSEGSERKTQVNFRNKDESTELDVRVKANSTLVITNTTDQTKTEYSNNDGGSLYTIKYENTGGLKRSFFNNQENIGTTSVGDVITHFSVSIEGDQISKISSDFLPKRKSCVLDQHRGSYVSTICESDRLCFASGTDGSPAGGTLHFIGGFLDGTLKVSIHTKKEDLRYEIEYSRRGDINVKRTTSVKENNVIYSGNHLGSKTSNRSVISVKDLGLFFLIYVGGAEITKISKGGLGPDGNISCVQLVSNPSDNKSIYFELD